MKKLLTFLTVIFLTACGGGGGSDQTQIAPPTPPLTIDFSDSSHTTDEDVQLSTGLSITTNRSANLSYSLTNQPDYGSVSFSGTNFTYTPDANYYGNDEFEVTASAEGVSASAKVSLTINSINDVPIIEASLINSDDSEYPLSFTTVEGKLAINLSFSDIESSNAELTLTASADGQTITVEDMEGSSANLNFSNSFVAGHKSVSIIVSDGESSATSILNLWAAFPKAVSGNDNIYTLWGNVSDVNRGFRWAVVLDAMPSEEVLLAAREAFKYFIKDFVHNNNPTLVKEVNSMFNMVVIESPIGDSTLGVVTGSQVNNFENCPAENTDPDFYCISDLSPIIRDYANNYFEANYFDNYSVVTGINGRGVNLGNVNIQTLITAANCDEGCTRFTKGPNGMLSTLKHEFGHGYLNAGDGYITDFLATDDNGSPVYDLTSRYPYQEMYIDTSFIQDALKTQWSHQYSNTASIPGRDDQTDTSTSALGYWQGCYSHDTYCYRPSYNSIMNGYYRSSNDNQEWLLNRVLSDSFNYDRVGEEAFLLRSFVEQGMHDIQASLSSDNQQLNISTDFLFDTENYELRWYLSHYRSPRVYEEISGTRNQSSVTVERDPLNSHTTVAYRIVPLNSDSIIRATDDIETWGDVYNGNFGPERLGMYYCPVKESTWEAVERRICRSTYYGEWVDGSIYTSPIAFNNQTMVEYGYFKYWYEYSGLGAQFNINWTYY